MKLSVLHKRNLITWNLDIIMCSVRTKTELYAYVPDCSMRPQPWFPPKNRIYIFLVIVFYQVFCSFPWQ